MNELMTMQSFMELLDVTGVEYGMAADREKNRKERLTFIRLYAAWVRRVSKREWISQQAELIYALIREQYLRIANLQKSARSRRD